MFGDMKAALVRALLSFWKWFRVTTKYILRSKFWFGDILEKGKIPGQLWFIKPLRLEKLIQEGTWVGTVESDTRTVILFV